MARKFRAKKEPAGIDDVFKQEVDGYSREQLKEKVITIQNQIEESEVFMKTKDEIVKAKEDLKYALAGPRETIKHLKNRNKYVLQRMRDIGAI